MQAVVLASTSDPGERSSSPLAAEQMLQGWFLYILVVLFNRSFSGCAPGPRDLLWPPEPYPSPPCSQHRVGCALPLFSPGSSQPQFSRGPLLLRRAEAAPSAVRPFSGGAGTRVQSRGGSRGSGVSTKDASSRLLRCHLGPSSFGAALLGRQEGFGQTGLLEDRLKNCGKETCQTRRTRRRGRAGGELGEQKCPTVGGRCQEASGGAGFPRSRARETLLPEGDDGAACCPCSGRGSRVTMWGGTCPERGDGRRVHGGHSCAGSGLCSTPRMGRF